MPNRDDRRGFSLLELVITMSLLAILAATGIARLSGELRRRTTQIAVDQFATAHSLARSTAVRYGRVAQLHINASSRRFWVDVDTSGTGTGQRGTIWYVRDLSEPGLVMTSNRSLLCFDARGMPSTIPPCESADAQIIFTAADKADTLTTASLGKILR
ncbi:MAG TPA: GspH/FimT family pseudopilin [Gemmatimonadaceae bacterium]|jgi:prepilin-type N-terminal cleavage/methylation domain-containing protein